MIETETESGRMLPTTEAELDALVEEVTELYSLPPGDDTYDAIATMILHLPQTKVYVPSSYFGHSVLKSMANQVAFKKLKEFKEKREAKEKKAQDESLLEQPIQN